MARESEFLALDDASLRAVVGPNSRHVALIEDAFKVLIEAPGGGVADNAALGPAVRNIHHGALPGHPGREGLHLIKMHVLVVTDAALAGAKNGVVNHAVAFEHAQLAVVHRHGQVHDDLLVGRLENVVRFLIEAEDFGGDVEARHHGFERVFAVHYRSRLFIDGVGCHSGGVKWKSVGWECARGLGAQRYSFWQDGGAALLPGQQLQQRQYRQHQQERIEAVEQPAVAGHDAA